MADLCKACSIDTFGEDHRDLAFHDWQAPKALDWDEGYPAICESCGFILVDGDGICLGIDGCLLPIMHSHYYAEAHREQGLAIVRANIDMMIEGLRAGTDAI